MVMLWLFCGVLMCTVSRMKAIDVKNVDVARLRENEFSSCDAGWTEFNGKCYQLVESFKTWQGAREHCQSLSGDLPSLSSNQCQVDFVAFYKSIYPDSNTRFWIGLNDIDSEGNFVWTDGTTLTYTNWPEPNPDNWNNEDCVDISQSTQWNDRDCTHTLSFICVTGEQVISRRLERLTIDSWYCSHQYYHNILSEPQAVHPKQVYDYLLIDGRKCRRGYSPRPDLTIMAGIGSIGSRISLSRSPSMKRKHSTHSYKSTQGPPRERYSIQSQEVHLDGMQEGRRLFHPIRQYSSIDTSNYSALQQIIDYKYEATGSIDFLNTTIDLLFSTVVMKILLFLLGGYPIAMLIVGTSYKTDCPKEPKLPLFLIVGGGFGLLKIVFLFLRQRDVATYARLDEKSDFGEETEDLVLARFVRFSNLALSVFLVTWFAFGNYWFYSIWEPRFKQQLHSPNDWCHPTLYWFTFYCLVADYFLFFFISVSVMFIMCYYGNRRCCRKSPGVL